MYITCPIEKNGLYHNYVHFDKDLSSVIMTRVVPLSFINIEDIKFAIAGKLCSFHTNTLVAYYTITCPLSIVIRDGNTAYTNNSTL